MIYLHDDIDFLTRAGNGRSSMTAECSEELTGHRSGRVAGDDAVSATRDLPRFA